MGRLCWRRRRHGALFAVTVQSFVSVTSVAPCPAEATRKRGYKLSRSQKSVTVQDYNCGQMRMPPLSEAKGPGAKTITNLSLVQEQKQKV